MSLGPLSVLGALLHSNAILALLDKLTEKDIFPSCFPCH